MHPPEPLDQPQPAIPSLVSASLSPQSAGQRMAAQTCSIVMAVVGGMAVVVGSEVAGDVLRAGVGSEVAGDVLGAGVGSEVAGDALGAGVGSEVAGDALGAGVGMPVQPSPSSK